MAYGHGHCTGMKKERRSKGTPWYAAIQAEALRKVEMEWAAKQAQQQEQQK